jgi:methylmalonyl-CoA mutase C-terminal domain/subunit
MSGPTSDRPIRVLVAKPGLDGHDRGAKVVAAALRDAGMEVVYTGLHQTPPQVVEAAVQEDVEVVGLSMHSGAHGTLAPAVIAELERRDAAHMIVVVGGIIPDSDIPALEAAGIARVFTPGTPTTELAEWIRAAVTERRAAVQEQA